MDIREFRRQFPEYDRASDHELSQALHRKYYPHVDYNTFAQRFGVSTEPAVSVSEGPLAEKAPETARIAPAGLGRRPAFDPEGEGYDYESARAAGLGADETGHWPSRDPKTGLILKGRKHPTFAKTIKGEKAAGYELQKDPATGRYFSRPVGDQLQAAAAKLGQDQPSPAAKPTESRTVTEPKPKAGSLLERLRGSPRLPPLSLWDYKHEPATGPTFVGEAGPAWRYGTQQTKKVFGAGAEAVMLGASKLAESNLATQWLEAQRRLGPGTLIDPFRDAEAAKKLAPALPEGLQWARDVQAKAERVMAQIPRPPELQGRDWWENLKDPNTQGAQLMWMLGANIQPTLAIMATSLLAGAVSGAPGALYTGSMGAYLFESGASFDELREMDVPEDEALTASAIVGGLNAVLEVAPLARLGAKIPVVRRLMGSAVKDELVKQPKVLRAFTEMLKQGAWEGSTEALQEIVHNAAKRVYDENQSLFEGMGESAFVGGIIGALFGGAGAVVPQPSPQRELGREMTRAVDEAQFAAPAEQVAAELLLPPRTPDIVSTEEAAEVMEAPSVDAAIQEAQEATGTATDVAEDIVQEEQAVAITEDLEAREGVQVGPQEPVAPAPVAPPAPAVEPRQDINAAAQEIADLTAAGRMEEAVAAFERAAEPLDEASVEDLRARVEGLRKRPAQPATAAEREAMILETQRVSEDDTGPFPEPKNAVQARDQIAWVGQRLQSAERVAGERWPQAQDVTEEERRAASNRAKLLRQEDESLRNLLRVYEQPAEPAPTPAPTPEPPAPRGALPTEAAPEPAQPKPEKPKAARVIDPIKDDLLAAIAKAGGISRAEAEAQGIDPAEFGRRGWKIHRVFTTKGDSFDGMAERLAQYGYITRPEYRSDELAKQLDRALGGQRVMTAEGQMAAAEREAHEQQEPDWPAVEDVIEREAVSGDNQEIARLTALAFEADEIATERAVQEDITDAELINRLNAIVQADRRPEGAGRPAEAEDPGAPAPVEAEELQLRGETPADLTRKQAEADLARERERRQQAAAAPVEDLPLFASPEAKAQQDIEDVADVKRQLAIATRKEKAAEAPKKPDLRLRLLMLPEETVQIEGTEETATIQESAAAALERVDAKLTQLYELINCLRA